jgi:hypothetical protein
MQGVSVSITEDSHSLDPKLLGSSHDPAGDLTTIQSI